MGLLFQASVGQSRWGDPLTILTAVIAGATVAYVVCTVFLWRATKKSADAAKNAAESTKQAADESKRSTDILAGLNRPYMGVHRVAFEMGAPYHRASSWQITWDIRNFGTLPALAVNAKVEFYVEHTRMYAFDGPQSAEIFPQSDPVSTLSAFEFQGLRRDEVMSGDATFTARISIAYASSSGQRYEHQADARFNRGYGTFSVVKSETKFL